MLIAGAVHATAVARARSEPAGRASTQNSSGRRVAAAADQSSGSAGAHRHPQVANGRGTRDPRGVAQPPRATRPRYPLLQTIPGRDGRLAEEYSGRHEGTAADYHEQGASIVCKAERLVDRRSSSLKSYRSFERIRFVLHGYFLVGNDRGILREYSNSCRLQKAQYVTRNHVSRINRLYLQVENTKLVNPESYNTV